MKKNKQYGTGGDLLSGAGKGATLGASVGSVFPGIGTAIGAGVGALVGGVGNALINAQDVPEQTSAVPLSTGNNNHMFAGGGDFSEIDAGGTHEANPNGGVPMGNSGATVEEGETKMGTRVFSNRLINPTTGNTFADDSKKYVDTKRPNDPISNRYTEKQLDTLFNTQEAMKPQETPQGEQLAYGGDYGGPLNPNLYDIKSEDDLFLKNGYVGGIDPYDGYTGGYEATPRSYDKTVLTELETPEVAPNSTLKTNTEVNPSGARFSGLQYAPLIGDAINIASTLANKPEEKDLNMFNTNTVLQPHLTNREQINRDITSSSGAVRELLPDATRGNAGSYLSNLQGSSLNTGKAIGQASLASNIADNTERGRVDQLNMRRDMINQRNRMQVANMNDADKAAYRSQLQDSTANLAQNIGGVGKQQNNVNMVNEMFGYDIHGQYKALKAEGKTSLNFKQWVDQIMGR